MTLHELNVRPVFDTGDGSADAPNAMSVDVEDYFQVKALSERIDRNDWTDIPHRVESNVLRILELFDQFDTRATFFTLGWVAERYPDMIRQIAAHGHEIASHGWDHEPADRQDRQRFREDVTRSRKILEDTSGQAVIGYRAASFSINASNLWALDELAECGYRYSSSIYPVRHDIYGLPGAPRVPFHTGESEQIVEWPGTTVSLLGRRWACGGGGYFRILPYAFFRWAFERARKQSGQPCFFYFHPWELDAEQPRVPNLSWRSRFRHYANLDRTEPRLRRLLADFRWDRFDTLLGMNAASVA